MTADALIHSPAATRAFYVCSLLAHRVHRLFATRHPDGVPLPPRSLALAAKRMVDELALTTVTTFADLLSDTDRTRITGEVQRAIETLVAQGAFEAPERFHPAPPPLADPDVVPAGLPGFRYEHLSFDSGFVPSPDLPGRERWLSYAANRRAHAWVLRHPGGPRPWLLCIHPFQTGSAFLTLGAFRAHWLHRRFGVNVLCPVLPLHGPRRAGARSGDGLLAGDYLNTLHGLTQAVWDVRRMVGWMRAQGDPDVGVYGLSLGGYVTALLAALDADLACVIAGVPAVDFVALERWHTPPWSRRRARRAGTDWASATRLLQVVSPLALTPRVPHARRFLFAGLGDQLAPPALVHELWRHWEGPRTLWFEGGHISCRWERSVTGLLTEALRSSGLTAR